MAIFHLAVKTVSRGKGQSAIAKAAYNSREVIRDEQTGELKNEYSSETDPFAELRAACEALARGKTDSPDPSRRRWTKTPIAGLAVGVIVLVLVLVHRWEWYEISFLGVLGIQLLGGGLAYDAWVRAKRGLPKPPKHQWTKVQIAGVAAIAVALLAAFIRNWTWYEIMGVGVTGLLLLGGGLVSAVVGMAILKRLHPASQKG